MPDAAKPLDEFLNPKSMVTPGIAGAMTTLLTATLANQFSVPSNWTALIISFAFGLLVALGALPWWQRAIFYVVNSLIIFSVAVGANTAGVAATRQQGGEVRHFDQTQRPEVTHDGRPFFHEWF